MRRLAPALTLLVLSLSACGSSAGQEPPAGGSEPDSGSDAASGSAFPVTIEHKYGSTTIEEQPQRVVTVGLTDQDALLALGTVPVATTFWFGEHDGNIFPWAQRALGDADVPEVLDTEQEFEQVAGLQPDLILAIYAGISEKDYDLYSEIAPVVAAPAGFVDYGTPWQQATTVIGQAVGQVAEAERLVADVEDRIAAAREAHPEFRGLEAATATIYEGIFVYGPQDPRGRFLTDLGFTFPDRLTEAIPEEFGGSISPERADLIDLDALVWIHDAEPIDETVPTYRSLAVARQGRDVLVPVDDPLYEATSFVTVLSLPFLLDGLVPRLAAAVDGDPGTRTG